MRFFSSQNKLFFRASLLMCGASLLAITTNASAQTATPPSNLPPTFSEIDENGVDLTSGALIVSRSDIAIGNGATSLTYGEVSGSSFGRREIGVLILRSSAGYIYFSTADKTSTFKAAFAGYEPVEQDGSRLELLGQNWVFTGRDGTVATLPITNQIITPGSVVGPDGKTTTYYWEQQ